MSSHIIGNGMNDIVNHILNIYDSGNIRKEIAKSIISECVDVINKNDGNSDEGLMCFKEQNRCSCCLNKVKEIELYSFGNIPNVAESVMKKEWLGEYTVGLTICRNCLSETFNRKVLKDE